MTRHLGLDFGTTNSALAIADRANRASVNDTQLVRFPVGDDAGSFVDTFRSVLFFDFGERDKRGRPLPYAGPRAITRYVAGDGTGRLMQSLKSQLASRLFTSTMVAGRPFTLEELITTMLTHLRRDAEAQVGPLGSRLVCGRPVRFTHAEDEADDAFAVARLTTALAAAGFTDVVFEYEPVGAAYHYERSLDHDELVLIADFGGGTSDFCLVRVGKSARKERSRSILGTEGVALAGDVFDSEIVQHVVSPAVGMGSRYRLPMSTSAREDETMEVPPWIYQKLRRWHHLSFLKSKDTLELLEELRKQSLEPAKIEALVHVVTSDLGFHLYKAVERSKIELSREQSTHFRFVDEPTHVEDDVPRGSFEQWISPSLAAIEGCIDRLLEKTGTPRSAVDRVFMTGGTSLVPAVRAIFSRRFGDEKLCAGDELTSVALGLALRAADAFS